MQREIKIEDRLVGAGEPCFIIAEAGVNHNGDINLAKKLVDVAKDAGVDAVKFQTFKSEGVVIEECEIADYARENMGKNIKQIDMIKKLELKYEDFVELKRYCDKKGIMFLSTPHSYDAIDFLEPLVPIYKIGSGDLTNLPFLEKIAKKGKPIILSTGMSNLGEIEEAVGIIKKTGCDKITLLQCTTNYPTKMEEINLSVMETLKHAFKLPIGFSDHSLGINAAIGAVALGACIIEKHFTLDKNLPGPDHKASLEPDDLKAMVNNIRDVEKALGNGIKKPTKEEDEIKKVARKSIVAKTDIPEGTIITKDMLEIKRPGIGIKPKYYWEILGGKTKRTLKKGELIRFNDLE